MKLSSTTAIYNAREWNVLDSSLQMLLFCGHQFHKKIQFRHLSRMVLHESQMNYHKEMSNSFELSRVCQLRKINTETKSVAVHHCQYVYQLL